MSGSATLTTVMSSSSMKIATDTAIKVHHLRSTRPPRFPLRACSEALYEWGSGLRLLGVRSVAAEVALEERHDLAPQLRRRLRSVRRPVVGEEGVAGAVVD